MKINLPNREHDYNQHNLNRISQRIDDVLLDHARILIIRVDFYIRKDFNQDVERDFMIKALERLRNNMRSNKTIFNGYISYIAKLEYTPDRGWHYHMAFIFNGSIRQSEYGIAQQLVNYWQTVIAGMVGNGNTVSGAEYPTNGTGMVHYADTEKIEAVKYALSYLAKNDVNSVNKAFVDNLGRNQQAFFMSQYVPKNGHRGRPRALFIKD